MKYRCKETNQKSLLKSFIRQILVRQYFYVICKTVPFLSLESKGNKEGHPADFLNGIFLHGYVLFLLVQEKDEKKDAPPAFLNGVLSLFTRRGKKLGFAFRHFASFFLVQLKNP